jgi:hypothetical protein
MDTYGHFHLIGGRREGRSSGGGTVQLVSATPIDPVLAFSSMPSWAHDLRPMPFSAAAPTIFSTTRVPATPRRPVLWVDFSTTTFDDQSLLGLQDGDQSARKLLHQRVDLSVSLGTSKIRQM